MKILNTFFSKISPSAKEELNMLDQWKKEHIKELEALENIHGQKDWQQKVASFRDYEPGKAWYKLEYKIKAGSTPALATSIPLRKVLNWAAVIALVLVAVWLIPSRNIVNGTNKSYVALEERKNLILDDQTTVVMEVGTKILQSSFRKVDLEGRAFFEVAKNPDHIFEIKTPQATIQVLGTAFSVLADIEKSAIKVTEGKVAVFTTGQKVILEAGEEAIVKNQGIHKRKINFKNLSDWRQNVLEFDNIHIREVLQTVAEHYQMDIVIQDQTPVSNCLVKTKFINVTVEEVLKELSLLTKLEYSLQRNKIIITKIAC